MHLARLLHYVVVFAVATAATSFGARAQLQGYNTVPQLEYQAREPFGGSADQASTLSMWKRWREFKTGVEKDVGALARCRVDDAACSEAELRLVAIIASVRQVAGRAKIGIINRSINLTIAYASDALRHAKDDVWSSAIETITAGRGDCEDFAIVKYVALREAGIQAEDLRLLVGKLRYGEAHAVLAVKVDGRWLILDNRRMTMVDDSEATEMRPLFAFDSEGIKHYDAPKMFAGPSFVEGAYEQFPPAAAPR